MKEARHIATGRIVRASEVDYPEYYGIFQCPHCKVGLRLRKEYTRSDGTTITAAFIHPPGETVLEKQCPYRINLNFSATKSKISYPHSREQYFKLLKKNFLKYLKYKSEVSLTEHYSTNQAALEAIAIFIALNKKIIAAPQNGRYILEIANSQKIEQLYKDKIYQKINSYSKDSIQRKILILSIESQLSFIKENSNSLIWGLEFIINEASDDFIEKILSYIFGKYVYKQEIKGIELEDEIENVTNFGEIKKVLGFDLSIIKKGNEILSNDKLINDFFKQIYTQQLSDSNAVLFNEIKIIHNEVFNHIINYLVDFPWKCLLS